MKRKDATVCGIDIGSSKIVTLIAFVGEDEKISLIGAVTTPSRGVKKGQIVDIESAAEAIKDSLQKAERMAGHQMSSAYLSIGGAHIECTNSHATVAVTPVYLTSNLEPLVVFRDWMINLTQILPSDFQFSFQ